MPRTQRPTSAEAIATVPELAKNKNPDDIKGRPSPGPVPQEAMDFFKAKGLKPSFSYKDVWAQEHSFAFTVAKIMEIGVLNTVRSAIDKAIEDGSTLADFEKQVRPALDQSGWSSFVKPTAQPSRLRLIFETNMRTARANGQADRIQRTKQALPYLKYELGPSKAHRDEHKAWAGLTLSVDDAFWKEHFPPNGYNCKCRVRQISKHEADKSGGPDDAPEEERVEWRLPDGRTGSAPAGVHPSFAYPMGTSGREKSLNASLDAAQSGEDGPTPKAPEKTHVQAEAPDPKSIARGLSDGARRVLREFVALCPNELDTTGVCKFQGDVKTVRKHLDGELTNTGLVGRIDSQPRLNRYPTDLARKVAAILTPS